MPTSGSTDIAFSPAAVDGPADEADYRTVSVLAVVSLLVGIASPLCMLAPLLWAIPLFGGALAFVALGRIARSSGAMIGRRAALIGLALCVASICAASSRTLVSRHLRTRQAMAVGLKWIELLQAGQMDQAMELTTWSLHSVSASREEQATEEDPAAQFAASPVVKALAEIGQKGDVRFDGNLSYVAGGEGQCQVEQQYVVTPTDGQPGRAPTAVRLTLKRAHVASGVPMRWLITDYQGGDLPAGSADGG